jgi:hypothetical protein
VNADELRAWIAAHKAQAAAVGAGTILIALLLWRHAKVKAARSSSDQQQASGTGGTAGGTVPGGGQYLVPYDGTADYSGNGTGSDGLSGPATLQGSLDALNGQLAQLNAGDAALIAALPGGTLLGGNATGAPVDNPGPTGGATGNGGQTGQTSTPGNGTTTGHPPAHKTVHHPSHAPAKKHHPAPHPATHKPSHPAHPAHPTHPAHPAHPTHPAPHPATTTTKKRAPAPAHHPTAAHPAPHPAPKPKRKAPARRK